jgi:hypothetical protein
MRYAKIVESSRSGTDVSVKSIDVRLMVSYVVVLILLLTTIFVFSNRSEPDPSQFVSSLVLP